jgi:hypothetical protein
MTYINSSGLIKNDNSALETPTYECLRCPIGK